MQRLEVTGEKVISSNIFLCLNTLLNFFGFLCHISSLSLMTLLSLFLPPLDSEVPDMQLTPKAISFADNHAFYLLSFKSHSFLVSRTTLLTSSFIFFSESDINTVSSVCLSGNSLQIYKLNKSRQKTHFTFYCFSFTELFIYRHAECLLHL